MEQNQEEQPGVSQVPGVSKRRSQNVIIDIESEDLTYNQARSIRQQIQKDVEQLQNRVRMLQQEEQRALKKIQETRKKTKEIQELQERNDEKYRNRLLQVEKIKIGEENQRRSLLESRMKSSQDSGLKFSEIKQQKLQSVSEVRTVKEHAKVQISEMRLQQQIESRNRQNRISQEKKMSLMKQNEFIKKKVADARGDYQEMALSIQNEITDYEQEARELEKMEAELLRKLQETQKNEREAFGKLENAMVDASVPKNLRVGASMTGGSNRSRSGRINERIVKKPESGSMVTR